MEILNDILRITIKIYQRLLFRNKKIRDIFGSSFDIIVRSSIETLGVRHFAGKKYKLPMMIEYSFSECIEDAVKAFINKLFNDEELSTTQMKFIEEYFSSKEVTVEVSKLLEPGVEFFDIYALTDKFLLLKSNSDIKLKPEEIFEAWQEYLKGFSFSSRSKPAFREFLSASYEEGSFLALTDIRSAIEGVESSVESLHNQRGSLNGAINDYEGELRSYKDWAKNFDVNSDKRRLQ